MSLQSSTLFPLPIRKGARGMVSAPFEAKPLQRRVQRGGASLPGVSGGVPLINYQTGWVGGKNHVTLIATIPRAAGGSPEGRNPFGRRSGGCPSRVH